MLAPRLGVVYDVFGDSSLKVFGSFGIYYDVMKLYMAELTFGGWKRKQDYYALKDPDWTKIAASGEFNDKASQEAGDTYAGSLDFLPPSFGRVDPNLKPTAQREISFGAEKKLSEDLSLSVRLVNKSLLRTIEDVGALAWVTDPVSGVRSLEENFWIVNPGFGWSLPESQGGKFARGPLADPEGQEELLRREHRPGKEVQQQLAGRFQLHLEPDRRQLFGPGQHRRGRVRLCRRRPRRSERRAVL